MSEYRLIVAGARTGTISGELPLASNLNLNLLLSRPGGFSFTLPRDAAAIIGKHGWTSLYPGSHAAYLERDSTVIFGGVIQSASAKSREHGIEITATGWWDHWRSQLLRIKRVFSNTDVYDIIRSVYDSISRGQHISGPKLKLQFPTAEDRGVNRTVTYESWELKSFASIVEEWAAASDSEFDFDVRSYRETSERMGHTIAFYHPEFGSTLSTKLRYASNDSAPNTISDYQFSASIENHATQLYGVGKGEQWTKKISRQVASWTGNIYGGLNFEEFPARDGVYSRQDIGVQSHLDEVTRRRLKYAETPPIAFGLTLSRELAVDEELLKPGNKVQVDIEDGYVQVSEVQRITGVNISLGDDYAEKITLQTARPYLEE